MKRLDIIKELLGSDKADLIAEDIKNSYLDIIENFNSDGIPIYSYNKIEERDELEILLDAMQTVYKYYSVDSLPDYILDLNDDEVAE